VAKDKSILNSLYEDYDTSPEHDAIDNAQTAAASSLNPEQEGRLIDQSAELGKPVEILRNQSELEYQRAKLQSKQNYLTNKRKAADWMAENPNNALLSIDDVDGLESLARSAQFINREKLYGPEESFGFWERSLATLADIGDKGIGGIGSLSESFYGLLQFGAEVIGAEGLAEYAADKAQIGSTLAVTLSANLDGAKPEDFSRAEYIQDQMNKARFDVMGISVGDVVGAGVSLAPTLVGGWALRGLSEANKLRAFGIIAGLQGAGSQFASERREGADFTEAATQATASGLITGLLTRVIPGGPENALDDLAKRLAVAHSPKEMLRYNLIKATGVQFVSEAFEEGLDEMLQALLVDGSSWEEAIDRGLKAGVIGGILGGAFGAVGELAAKRQQESLIALGFKDGLTQVAEDLDRSKTAQRSVEAATQFLQNHGGLNKTAYIDALAAKQIASTPEGKQQLERAGITENTISNAIKEDTTIPVDTARMMAATKGEVRQQFIEQVRNTPGAKNAVEAQLEDDKQIEALVAKYDQDARDREKDLFREEVSRLVVEVAESLGAKINEKDGKRTVDSKSAEYESRARDQVELLVKPAVAWYNRHPGAFRTPLEFLKSVSFERGKFAVGDEAIGTQEGEPLNQQVPRGTPDNIGTAENMGDTFESRREWFQAAYHGTPHKFDKFSLDAIGTGEGAQAFGWGLYFTSEQGIAEFYRDSLASKDLVGVVGEKYGTTDKDASDTAWALLHKKRNSPKEYEQYLDGGESFLGKIAEDIENGTIRPSSEGEVKTVDIPESEDLLQWDKPLSEMTDTLQEIVERRNADNDPANGIMSIDDVMEKAEEVAPFHYDTEGVIWRYLISNDLDALESIRTDLDDNILFELEQIKDNHGFDFDLDADTGMNLYRSLEGSLGSDRAASSMLNDIGIPGLEYPAGTIGGGVTDPNGRNFVIWDEDAITVQDVQEQQEFFQSQEETDGQPLGSMRIVDERYIVSLFDNANATTILHEIGHIWQEEIRQAIASGNATEQLSKDWMTLSEWQVDSTPDHIAWMKKQLANPTTTDAKKERYRKTIDWLENASDKDKLSAAVSFGGGVPNEFALDEEIGTGLAESYHELFARGAESYLFEGNAPSKALERPFARFAKWISRTYKSIFGEGFQAGRDLLVNISDDVRQVFNRLLATDAEIEALMFYNGLLADAEAELDEIPGLDKEARGKIGQLYKQSIDEIFNAEYKARTKAANKKRKEFKSDLADQPVYRAWSEIRDAGGLRKVQVESIYGKDTVRELRKKGLIAKADESGAIPDAVASRHGYEDGDDLIADLLDARPLAEQTQLELERTLFDAEIANPSPEKILDSPSFRKAVDEMAKALSQSLRGGLPMKSRRIISDEALGAVADMDVYDASQVYKYLQEAQWHYNENRRALARNDYEKAMQELESGVRSEETARHGRDVRKLSGRLLRKVKRLKKTDPRKIDYNFYYHAIKTAEMFGLIKPDPNMPPPDFDLLGTIRQDSDAGFVDPAIDFADWLLAPEASTRANEMAQRLAERVPGKGKRGPRAVWQVMRSYELQELEQFINFLETRGKDLADPAFLTMEETLEDWAARADGRMAERDDKGLPKRDVDSIIHKISEKAEEIKDSFVAADHIFRTLDAQRGTVKDQDTTLPWYQLAMEGSARATDMREEISNAVYAAMSPHAKVVGEAIKRLDNDQRLTSLPVPQRMQDAGKKRWTGERALMVMLSLGNSYNMQAVARGLGFFNEVTDPVTNETNRVPNVTPLLQMAQLFTKQELQAVQGLWDAIETMWPASRKVHKQIYGKPPAKVKGESITLDASDGPVTLAGGYFPLRFDSKDQVANTSNLDDTAALEMSFGATFAPPHMKLGSNIARTDSGDKLVLLDPLQVIKEHIHSTSTYIAFAPWIRDMIKAFNTRIEITDKSGNTIITTMEGLMRRKVGDSSVKQLKSWMRALAGNEQQNLNWVDRLIRNIKAKASIFLLGANIRGPLSVMDAIPTLASDVGYNNYFREVNLFASEESGLAAWRFILDSSGMMQRRLKGANDRDAREVYETLSKRLGNKAGGVREQIVHWALSVYSVPGIIFEMPAWMAIYKKTMAENGGNHDSAVIAADLAIRNTQPSSDLRDQSMAQRDKKGFINTALMFTSWAITRFNTVRGATRSRIDKRMSVGEYSAFIFAQLVLSTFPFAFMAAIAHALTGDDEDREGEARGFLMEVGRGAVVDTFRGIPLISNVAQAGFDSFVNGEPRLRALYNVGDIPAMQIMGGVVARGLTGIYDSLSTDDPEERTEAIWNIAHLAAFAAGIPVSRAAEQLSEALISGEK